MSLCVPSPSSYNALQSQLKKSFSQGLQGQVSYTFGKCRDLSSAPVKPTDTLFLEWLFLCTLERPVNITTGSDDNHDGVINDRPQRLPAIPSQGPV